MAIPLVAVTRGEIVECVHRGDIAVVSGEGELLYSAGDPYKVTYMRSAAKPIQALNVIISGAADTFQFTDTEMAVICSSHYAEPFHLEAVESILSRIGLHHSAIKGGIVPSLNAKYALELARDQVELNPTFSDCSGKHAGMLSVCRCKNYSVADYLLPDHPCQLEIKKIMGEVCGFDQDTIVIGIDGCSAPVHALPLLNMALGFARLSNPEYIEPAYQEAARRIFSAMTAHPEMISGTGGFCSDLIRASNGKLIGKVGAEGVYCVGIKNKNFGIAVKMESGSMAMLPPVVVSVLDELHVLTPEEQESLSRYQVMDNLNDVETVVGKISPTFSLKNHNHS